MNVSRRRSFAFVSLAVAGLALAGCQRTESMAKPGSTANQADLDFITNAYDVIHFDTELCQTAEQQATDPKVKAMAARILQEAEIFRAKVKPIADAEGIQPPQVLRNDLRIRLGHARLQTGTSFDQTFLADEIATHEEALQRAEMMMSEPGGNPQLQAYAKEGIQLLQGNMGQLVSLQKKVGMAMS
jgi:predicted outer membrane protein